MHDSRVSMPFSQVVDLKVVPGLVSVIVTTYNRSDALAAVMRGLSAQTDLRFEVVIADDGSNPKHRDAVLALADFAQFSVVHVWHPDAGFTAAKVRNLGVAASRGEYLIFLDGDCVPEKDFIAQHRRLSGERQFVNGSRVLLSQELTRQAIDGTVPIVGQSRWFWWKHWVAGRASRFIGTWRLPDGVYRVKKQFSWRGIRSCNLAVWRADFAAVDGFDEIYVGWGHEDADLVLRLHHAGILRKNGFCATEVFHLWHKEASRSQESANWTRVKQRALSAITRSEIGYSQSRESEHVVVTRLR